MAKNTESTAVNELIQIVTTQKPLRPDPSEDLMFNPPKETSGSRMTSTITGRAGDLAPLPRHRSPNGTEQGLNAVTPPVRVSTAPSRSMTIPPLPQASVPAVPASPAVPMPPVLPSVRPPVLPAEVRRPVPPPQRMPSQANATLMGTGPRGIPPVPPAPPRPLQAPTVMGPGQAGSGPRIALPLAAPVDPASLLEAPAFPRSAVARDQPPTVSLRGLREAADLAEQADKHEQHEETWVGTVQVQRRTHWKHLAGKLAAPMVILVVLGVFIGGYFAFDGEGGQKRTPKQVAVPPAPAAVKAATDLPAPKAEPLAAPASEPVASPPAAASVGSPAPAVTPPVTAPVAAPVVAPVVAPAPAVAQVEPPAPVVAVVKPAPAVPSANLVATPTPSSLVDVRIDSKPSGATVMLVDRGKTTFLGNTPISTAVDPSRTYELVFSYANKPSQIEKLDPATTKRVAVTLGKHGATTKTDAKSDGPKIDAPKVEAPKKARATVEPPEAPKATRAVVEPKPAGEGTLMISSKPPCEIFIDGKSTGLTTPQRAIAVAAGSHKVTLVNQAEKVKKTITVQVTADEPTKVIQDLMK